MKLAEEIDVKETSRGSIFLGFEMVTAATEKLDVPKTESVRSQSSKSDGPSVATVESDQGPRIELLWSFQCPMTKGYNVTSIDWNQTNQVEHTSAITVIKADTIMKGQSLYM